MIFKIEILISNSKKIKNLKEQTQKFQERWNIKNKLGKSIVSNQTLVVLPLYYFVFFLNDEQG